MPKNRVIPFGYRMVNGRIQTNPDEVLAVITIFKHYLDGMSLKAIASEMTVPYSIGTVWNKNMVKRILENEKYLGTDKYPQLIDADTFRKANALRVEKATSLCTLSADMKIIRDAAYCAECGNRLFRHNDTGLWDCRNKYCFPFDFTITDQMLTGAILHMLNTVIANPALLETNGAICAYEPTAEVVRKENEIGHMMDQPQPDYESIKKELLELAAQKYNCCQFNDRQQQTEQLKNMLTGRDQLHELDMELFKACVRALRVSHYYAIEMELTNGLCIQNITERTDLHDGTGCQCPDYSGKTADC